MCHSTKAHTACGGRRTEGQPCRVSSPLPLSVEDLTQVTRLAQQTPLTPTSHLTGSQIVWGSVFVSATCVSWLASPWASRPLAAAGMTDVCYCLQLFTWVPRIKPKAGLCGESLYTLSHLFSPFLFPSLLFLLLLLFCFSRQFLYVTVLAILEFTL